MPECQNCGKECSGYDMYCPDCQKDNEELYKQFEIEYNKNKEVSEQ